MTESGDLGELARRYLDLWEENLSQMADDREVAEIMARTIELMNSGTAAFASMAQSAVANERPKDDDIHNDPPPAASPVASRTPAAATAHGDTGHDLDEFARRLASLEKRIANLEGGGGKSRRRTGKRPEPG